MALDLPVQYVIEQVGHDGSAIVWDLPEPHCRRGFHPQELIRVAWNHGFSVTPFEGYPQLKSGETPITIYNTKIVEEVMRGTPGVLIGHRHAVAWDGESIFDPNGQIYSSDKFAASCFFAMIDLTATRSHIRI